MLSRNADAERNIRDMKHAYACIMEILVSNYPEPTFIAEIARGLRNACLPITNPRQIEQVLNHMANEQGLIRIESQYVCCATMTRYLPSTDRTSIDAIESMLDNNDNWDALRGHELFMER